MLDRLVRVRCSSAELESWQEASGGQLSGWLRDLANQRAARGVVDPVGSSEPVGGGVGLADAVGQWRCPWHPTSVFGGPDDECPVDRARPVLVPAERQDQLVRMAAAVQRELGHLPSGELLHRAVNGRGSDEEAPEAAAGR